MMSRSIFYKLGGPDGHTPVETDLVELTPHEKRQVGFDKVGGVEIRTVFLSIDHSFGDGPPVVFETTIFGGKHDEYHKRYCTWTEAKAGHKKAVAMVAKEAR